MSGQSALPVELIYCAGGNEAKMRIAQEEGWLLGSRSDCPTYGLPMELIDIDYKNNPNFEKHLRVVDANQPKYACAEDLSDNEFSHQDIDRALAQAEQLKNYCQYPLIIPKLAEQVEHIPADYLIGYSIPTSNGGAKYSIELLAGRKVHLLGGSPHQQIQLYQQGVSAGVKVGSVDCNMHQRMANEKCKYWQVVHRSTRTRRPHTTGDWFTYHGEKGDKTRQLECFRESCRNIRQAWSNPYKLSSKKFGVQLTLL